MMVADIDKPMRKTIEDFNKSKHVSTVYCCAGHPLKKKDKFKMIVQVYVQFEMDTEQVGPFLSLAFSCLTEEMASSCSLSPRITRVFCDKWPRKKRERLAIQFYSDGERKAQLNKKQIKIARKYFQRLAEKTAATM